MRAVPTPWLWKSSCTDVAAVPPVRRAFDLKSGHSYHTTVNLRHQVVGVGIGLTHSLLPDLDRTVGKLKRAGNRHGAVEDLRDGFDITRLPGPDLHRLFVVNHLGVRNIRRLTAYQPYLY